MKPQGCLVCWSGAEAGEELRADFLVLSMIAAWLVRIGLGSIGELCALLSGMVVR